MEINFKAVKALSSPTRINILRELLEGENTPTSLSDSLNKAKSTITSHATILAEAGLIKRDEEQGRKRVVYQPTEKAKTIAKGRKKQVKFSIVTAAITGITSLALFSQPLQGMRQAEATTQTTTYTAERAASTTLLSQNEVFVITAALLLIVTGASLWYGYLLHRLTPSNPGEQ